MNINEHLIKKCKELKLTAYEMVIKGGKGHLGGSFSCAEIMTYLFYSGIARLSPNPSENKDHFILSKGHANSVYYAILADKGYVTNKEIENYSKNGSILGGHCDITVPGIEVTTGSLGHGLGISCGIAMGEKLNGTDSKVFVIVGDGECQEGSIWEAILFARQQQLDNLILIVDANHLGSEDFISRTANLYIPGLADKFEAFDWNAITIDGHNFDAISLALNDIIADYTLDIHNFKPTVIISHTLKGNGMPTLEDTPAAHHTLPKGEAIETNRKALRQ